MLKRLDRFGWRKKIFFSFEISLFANSTGEMIIYIGTFSLYVDKVGENPFGFCSSYFLLRGHWTKMFKISFQVKPLKTFYT